MIEGLRSAAGKQPGHSEDVARVLQRSRTLPTSTNPRP